MPAFSWIPSPNLPHERRSFAGIGREEFVARARRLAPRIKARAGECEDRRRLTDDSERDLHAEGLFRVLQPARVGGADLDVGILLELCAELAKACPSTAWEPRQPRQPPLDARLFPAAAAGRTVGRLARRADRLDMMMELSGAGGLYTTGDMQRYFRDMRAVAAHIMYSFDVQATMFGQHALGIAGPPPML